MTNYTRNTQNNNLTLAEHPLTPKGNYDRDEKIRELRQSNPKVYSYRKLGRMYNVSSTRISQIVNADPQPKEAVNGQ